MTMLFDKNNFRNHLSSDSSTIRQKSREVAEPTYLKSTSLPTQLWDDEIGAWKKV